MHYSSGSGVIPHINIYGLGVGISTIKKITSGRRWGMTTRGLSYKVFNLPSHPDHKYIWLKIPHCLNSSKNLNRKTKNTIFIPGAQPHSGGESV
jgi:hypothetical protein